jgi:hypothetical protein
MRKSIVTTTALVSAVLFLLSGGGSAAAGDPIGNSIVIGSSTVLPLYPVSGDQNVTGVAYQLSGGHLTAYDQSGNQLWSVATSGNNLYGGFDFDNDGWPDAGVVNTTPTSQLCGSEVMNDTSLTYFSGKTGTSYTPTSPMLDKCWSFPGFTPYTTAQWTDESSLFGAGTHDLFVSPYYADTGWYFGFSGGAFTTDGALYYPSTSYYDSEYTADQPNAWGTGTSYVANSHVANGLFTTISGQTRLIFWTSGRVVQYKLSALSSDQLLDDKPYLTNNDTSLAGRNYGLVTVDPNDPSNIALIAGTATYSVWNDLRNGTLGTDGCGGIERHVSLYNASSNAVSDVFYATAPEAAGSSCSENPSQSSNYSNYVVFPPNPWVKVGAGQPSRLAYNVYGTDGQWHLHITEPGSLTDQEVLSDVFLWDIRDVNGDGTEEWVISPTGSATGDYFPERTTNLYTWTDSTGTLTETKSYSGLVPWLASSFRTTGTSNTSVFPWLYPALYTYQSGVRKLVMMNSSNAVTLVNP